MSNEKPLAVIAGSPDKPIVIAGTKVQRYVLEGGIRVLSQRGVFSALGRARITRNSGSMLSAGPVGLNDAA